MNKHATGKDVTFIDNSPDVLAQLKAISPGHYDLLPHQTKMTGITHHSANMMLALTPLNVAHSAIDNAFNATLASSHAAKHLAYLQKAAADSNVRRGGCKCW